MPSCICSPKHGRCGGGMSSFSHHNVHPPSTTNERMEAATRTQQPPHRSSTAPAPLRRPPPAPKGVVRAGVARGADAEIAGHIDVTFLAHACMRVPEHVCDAESGDGSVATVAVSVIHGARHITQVTRPPLVLALPVLLALDLAAAAARYWRKHDA